MSIENGDHVKPLALITVEDEKFVVHEDALKHVAAIEGPVGIIAIAGLYRTGKSYILNRLLGRQHGFEVGPTVNACTKGIYVWGEPLVIKEPDGQSVSFILIDTEGLGSMEQSQTYDAKIFSLAILFSSYFIYNSMGVIDERAIDSLSLVTNLTKHIHISEGHAEQNSAAFAEYFPHFVWLLRDFSLQLVDTKKNPITPRQYLDAALAVRSNDPSKNQIRDTILHAFATRDCYTLVRPVIDEDKLQAIDQLDFEELRPEFRTQIEEFKNKVLREAGTKKIGGHRLNGVAVAGLIRQYTDAINSDRVPTIASAWQNVVLDRNRQAIAAALRAYQSITANLGRLPVEAEDVWHAHESHLKKARDTYYRMAMGDNHAAYIGDLEVQMSEEFAKLTAENRSASERATKALLIELFGRIEQNVKDKLYDGQTAFEQDVADVWRSYASQARGPAKEASRIEFEQGRVSVARSAVAGYLQDRAREELDEERRKLAEAVDRVAQLELEKEQIAGEGREAALRAEHQEQSLRQEIGAAQEENAGLKAKLERRRAKAEAAIAALTKDRDELAAQLRSEKEELSATRRELEEMTRMYERAREQSERLTKSLRDTEKRVDELAAEKARSDKRVDSLEEQNALLTSSLSRVQQDCDKLVDQLQDMDKIRKTNEAYEQALEEHLKNEESNVYVLNALRKYLLSADQEKVLPVVASLLELSPSDVEIVRSKYKKKGLFS